MPDSSISWDSLFKKGRKRGGGLRILSEGIVTKEDNRRQFVW